MTTPCSGKCNITVNGTGFNADDGKVIHAVVIQQGATKGYISLGTATITNGSFSLQGMGVLQQGLGYNLNYYVDTNNNSKCDITPTDEVWRLSIPAVQDHVTLTIPYDMNYSNIGCGGF